MNSGGNTHDGPVNCVFSFLLHFHAVFIIPMYFDKHFFLPFYYGRFRLGRDQPGSVIVLRSINHSRSLLSLKYLGLQVTRTTGYQ
jgi:hypothetical protein